jgi:hypothetical protein
VQDVSVSSSATLAAQHHALSHLAAVVAVLLAALAGILSPSLGTGSLQTAAAAAAAESSA